jgi:hypothetical protein
MARTLGEKAKRALKTPDMRRALNTGVGVLIESAVPKSSRRGEATTSAQNGEDTSASMSREATKSHATKRKKTRRK